MSEPAIFIGGDIGISHRDLKKTKERLERGKQYKDLSTVCVVPTRGLISARVVESWMNLMMPMNNRFVRIFVQGMEVGDAYQKAVESILDHPMLRNFKYLLTLEEDNIPPPDGLLKLLESICGCKNVCKEHFAQVAGLYFTKGELGQPMIYGDPKGIMSFEPQIPKTNTVQECNGTGMGFTLFHLGLFKDKQVPQPWFKTIQEYDPNKGTSIGTQDLYFMANIRRLGYRIASDNRVKVGHYEFEENIVW
jgi:hypothetical protein